jgi:biopolymer transport protein ExbB/TolQ
MQDFLILFLILGFQIWFFVRSLLLIGTVRKLYPDESNLTAVEEIYKNIQQEIEIPKQYSLDFQEIIAKTKKYLLLNSGKEIDFFVVKDIAERQTEELENRTDSGLSVPLYIGLMGTFVGIAFGLVQLKDFNKTDINHFIFGVIIAMIGSFVGLLLTVILSHRFRNAKEKADKNQHNYLQFIEEKLLNLFTNDDHKIKRLEEAVSNFATNLNQFNKDFNSGFTKNTEDFSKNLKNLDKVSDNIKAQRELLDRLGEMKHGEMAQASVKIFEKVNQSAEMFQQFMGYQETLNKMLLHSHTAYASMQEQSKQITEALHTLLNRFSGFENGANQVGTYLATNLQNMESQVARINQHLRQNETVFVAIKENSQKIDEAVVTDAEERLLKMRELFKVQTDQFYNQTEQTKQFYIEQTEEMRKLFAELKKSLGDEAILKELLKQVNPLQKDIESQMQVMATQSKAIEEVKATVTQQQEKLTAQITEVVAKEMRDKQISIEMPQLPNYVRPILFVLGGAGVVVILLGILIFGAMVLNFLK